jgi:plasmid stabilization system protein ParE
MSRYLLTPRAERDFHEIRRWYERQRGTAAAHRVIRDLRSQLRNLALHPAIGHVQEDLASSEHLFWPHRQFLIVYLRGTNPLQIVTIWDARRGDPTLE